MSLRQPQYCSLSDSSKIANVINSTFGKHFHSNYELIYCTGGNGAITVNGRKEQIKKGDVLLIPPYALHSTDLENCTSWVAIFSKDYISAFDKKYGSIHYSKFTLDKDIDNFINERLLTKKEIPKFIQKSCLYMICNECIAKASIVNDMLDHKFVSEIIDYVTEHLEWDISLKEVSEALGYEYHYFSSLFHQHFDMNFKQFINRMRFETACPLLSQEKANISLISHRCGFGSIRNFNRVFKQFAGCSPTEYKLRMINSEQA